MAPEIVKCQIRDFCTMNGITLETKQNKVFCRERRNLIWSRKKKKIIFQNSLPQVCTNVGRLRDGIYAIFWPKKSKYYSWIPDRN